MQGNAASPVPRPLPKQDFLVGDWLVRPSLNLVSHHNVSTRLEPKVMQVLVCLADYAGEVVGKEQLISTVWTNTFVADQVLTHAIWQLRQVFRDDPKHPQFIETIAKGGYRLTAPVRTSAAAVPAGVRGAESEPATSPSSPGPMPAAAISREWGTTAAAAPKKKSRRRKYALGAAVLVFAAAVAAAVVYFRRGPAFTEKDSILLADFVNTTGDSVFDDALKQALAVQLEQSPYLNIVPEERVRGTLGYMGRSPEEKVTGSVAREICERENIKAMLTGSIAALGSQYVIALHAVNCRTGESLAREQITVDKKETVLPAVGEAASHLRRKLGESLPSIQKFGKPIEQATTSSLEALKAYTQGQELILSGQPLRAITFFQSATQLDPDFAMAYVGLAASYGNHIEEKRSVEYIRKAFALRDRVTEREKFGITLGYHWMVTGDLDKQIEIDELWRQTYPRDAGPANDLAFIYCYYLGQFEKAIAMGNEAIRLSQHVPTHAAVAFGYLGLNHVDEAKSVLESGLAQNPENVAVHWGLYQVAFLRTDEAGMQRELLWAAGNLEGSEILGRIAAAGAAQQGRLRKGRELAGEGVTSALAHDFKDLAAGFAAWEALTEAEFGNFRHARERAAASLALSRSRTNLPILAVVLALAGDEKQAQSMINDLDQRYPSDTQWVHGVYLPCARAVLESNRSSPAKGIEGLRATSRYELGSYLHFLPIYVRGLTYLRSSQAEEASVEFQKIIDHRGANPVAPEYSLAHLGLARAYLLGGDSARSRKAYQDFFALWKNADPDIPILKEAKAEYVKLQ